MRSAEKYLIGLSALVLTQHTLESELSITSSVSNGRLTRRIVCCKRVEYLESCAALTRA